MDWFERLTGFQESDYDSTRSKLEVESGMLRSKVNDRSYDVGKLEVLSLRELRGRVKSLRDPPSGKLKVSTIVSDVRGMHSQAEYSGALFQVASQFNLLEMTAPNVTPEDGVTRYQHDPTQGPACAIAAGAATIYRNYFAEVDGAQGQTARRQIDCLRELGDAFGNEANRLWTMRNGYAMCSESGLRTIRTKLVQLDEHGLDELRARLWIGVHWNVEVTDGGPKSPLFVSQAFCSALPVAYGNVEVHEWEPFAVLVLEAAYEATMLAAVLNFVASGSNVVLLTRLGGGAFGNDSEWIQRAMVRAMNLSRNSPLDVRLVCRGQPDSHQRALVEAFT